MKKMLSSLPCGKIIPPALVAGAAVCHAQTPRFYDAPGLTRAKFPNGTTPNLSDTHAIPKEFT